MSTSPKVLQASLKRSITWLRAELGRLEKDLRHHTVDHDKLATDIDNLQSVPGFGEMSAHLLAGEIPRHFEMLARRRPCCG